MNILLFSFSAALVSLSVLFQTKMFVLKNHIDRILAFMILFVANIRIKGTGQNMKGFYTMQNNAFRLCHKAFQSDAKMVYGTVYNIPDQIGFVDISTFSAVLAHFRDPFFALQNASKLTKETIIVTNAIPKHFFMLFFSWCAGSDIQDL